MEKTVERIKKVFESVFDGEIDISAVKPEAELIGDIGMNSIGMLYMAMALEEEFGIKFTNADFGELRTVNDVAALIMRKTAV